MEVWSILIPDVIISTVGRAVIMVLTLVFVTDMSINIMNTGVRDWQFAKPHWFVIIESLNWADKQTG